MRALLCRLREQDAVVRDNSDGISINVGESTNECCAVELLEFVKLGCVDDTRDDLPNIIGKTKFARHDAVYIFNRVCGILWSTPGRARFAYPIQVRHDIARYGERVLIIVCQVVGNA